ncbi:DNA polymerase IV [Rhodococcus spongiicola]|uniref:DNA polymerase IV n=1 Tax=Rhodococcus spongiicola TaxID=2487352 RepID=A0A3S3CL48_9NOCA|nr:DNA polymerase IV [Rhodococcus spongiicola]RVW00096.1 DNA polymerase IV [Rhodococcus spongiicola]
MGTPSGRRWVLHVDLDQFIAAVEVLRNPDLRGRPVIVGGRGDPSERGVVSTASYEAREFGVGSGMPLRTAARRIPDAVFLPVDAEAYREASTVVMNTLRGMDAVVEVAGWDEAFLGVETEDPDAFARRIQRAVLDATGLHCSVGIGDNKLRAKIATGFGKPRGIFRLTAENWFEVMGDRDTRELWGVGSKTANKLAALGLNTVSELASAADEDLAARFGPTMGPWFGRLGKGIDHSPVTAEPWVARSHSRETTFQENLDDWTAVTVEIRRLAARVLEDIVAEQRPAVRVAVKVRYAPFTTRSASKAFPTPTFDADVIADAAAALVARFDHTREVRLLGVRLEMTPPKDG